MSWSQILLGALAGGCAGAIMTFLSHVAPRFGAGNFIRDTDETHAFGKHVTRREAHFIGVLTHLLLSMFFGGGFALGVEVGWIPGYAYFWIVGWCMAISLVLGLVVMPLEGHGFFGAKHDAWFFADSLITNLIWGHLFLVLMHLWSVA